ncbi:MAG: EcsC family protein [Acidobacteria bacterium]|nr:EcsC family protein [Acidobacteriota bacterium]
MFRTTRSLVREDKSRLRRRLEQSLSMVLMRTYKTVRVDPDRFLVELRAVYGLPVTSFQGMHTVDVAVLDEIAEKIIHGAMKLAAIEGAGLGIGGLAAVIPDFSILAGITMRTIQKLSLVYGYQYNTEEEAAELWIAAASAAGIDLGRDFLETNVLSRFLPRIIRRVAARASGEFVEKWAGRLIPLTSSLVGGVLNYYFVRGWGERAHRHFRGRHLEARGRMLSPVVEGHSAT